jgi:hypothetical protein
MDINLADLNYKQAEHEFQTKVREKAFFLIFSVVALVVAIFGARHSFEDQSRGRFLISVVIAVTAGVITARYWKSLTEVSHRRDLDLAVLDAYRKTHTQMIHNVHAKGECEGEWCVIHKPSHHPMRSWPMYWREDRMLMERICQHGVGHPDPDDVAYHIRHGVPEAAVHSCDLCCTVSGPT